MMLPTRPLLPFLLAACFAVSAFEPAVAAHAPKATLAAYRSEAELADALDRWRRAAEKLRGDRRRALAQSGALADSSPAAPALSAAPAAAEKSADSASGRDESITNVQTAGVDEGGIVKRAGDHLVILRRGRLFTVRVGGDALRPVAVLDAYAPGADPRGAWYDELLVAGSTVVVVGYSYARGGTEIGLFELANDGALAYRATYHLRSFDYYSSRNYASRLIDRKLVFYTPTYLHASGAPLMQTMPSLRRWHHGATDADWQRILPAQRIYRTDDEFDPHEALALHTVTSCDLGAVSMRCEASAVLGPAGRVFYVSQGSVYVWTSPWQRRGAAPVSAPLSALFRIPLDGAEPSAIKTAGVPIDQLSFLEDAGGHINVLLRESGVGEGMWGSERMRGALSLLRVPLAELGDGRGSAERRHYRTLPGPVHAYAMQNRFVGDWLLWGGGGGDNGERVGGPSAWALRYADAAADPQSLHAKHRVERIEAMGRDALLVGNAGADLLFTSVRLGRGGGDAALAGSHVQHGASQGETRTHGFFFKPTGSTEGLLGLPVLQPGSRTQHGVYGGGQGSASVLYLRQRELAFTALGRLDARGAGGVADDCRASCVDWYGNARPIFFGERVFALLGYELVEGRLAGGAQRGEQERIEERRRIDTLAPYLAATSSSSRHGRYTPFGN